jgi:dihydroxyacetone kinase-like protein
MKKIINNADNFVEESISGLVKSYPEIYKYSSETNKVLMRSVKGNNKVGLVSGGGSGHLPLFTGYIGKGLLDSCAIGNVFASPSVDEISTAIKSANSEKGVLCIYGNYGGDVMNFDMASEMLEMEDIKVESVVVADDVASASKEEKEKRRGVTGMLYVFKTTGAIAESGADFDEVKRVALKTNENIRTMGIALTPTILPQAGKPTFEIGDDEMEIGMGIHGEPGIRRGKLKTANEITEELSEKLLSDIDLNKGDKVSILINSLGATPHEELFIVADKFNNILNDNGIINSKSYVGRYATSMEMAGMSITILKLDDELEKLLLEEANCPFWY